MKVVKWLVSLPAGQKVGNITRISDSDYEQFHKRGYIKLVRNLKRKVCATCRKTIRNKDYVYCPYCGKKLSEAKE